MTKKICVVVASRANYGRIKATLEAIKQHPDLELQLIVSASALLYRYGEVVNIIERDGFKIAAKVYSIVEGENLTTMAKSTGLGIIELATLFENLAPDVVLTVADRFETMATAIAASYMNIPIAHVQGGEVSGSIDESVRHAITKLSHIHFVATEASKERVIKMGEEPASVFNTGCPAIDIVADADLSLKEDFFVRNGGTGDSIDPSKPYLVVVQHPVTTEYGSGLEQVTETLNAIKELSMQTVWLWPNVDAGSDDISKALRLFKERNKSVALHLYRNFSVEDYAVLISNCSCLIGNSSSGIREGAFLGVPVVNIGTRQNKREMGANVINVQYKSSDIYDAVSKQLAHGRYDWNNLFGDGEASQRIAGLLADHTLTPQKVITY